MIVAKLTDYIGGTPVVETHRLLHPGEGTLLLKLEMFNPTGSVKDRAADAIVRQAEADGRVAPGGTLVEATSGNFGRSLAMIGATRGYRVVLVVDPKTPDESLRYVRALGAEIVMVDEVDARGSYQAARRRRAAELAASIDGAFNTNQYDNPANAASHYSTTAREILADVPDLDVLVAAASTGGHVSGVGVALKESKPGLEVVAVDAGGSALFCDGHSAYAMRGVGLSWQPGNLNHEVIDRVQLVSDEEAFAACRVLARREGIPVGESGGAVVFASLACAMAQPGRRVLGIIADGAANYLRDGAYDDPWLGSRGLNVGAYTVDQLRDAARNPDRRSFRGRGGPAAYSSRSGRLQAIAGIQGETC
jgi:cysteine synthase